MTKLPREGNKLLYLEAGMPFWILGRQSTATEHFRYLSATGLLKWDKMAALRMA